MDHDQYSTVLLSYSSDCIISHYGGVFHGFWTGVVFGTVRRGQRLSLVAKRSGWTRHGKFFCKSSEIRAGIVVRPTESGIMDEGMYVGTNIHSLHMYARVSLQRFWVIFMHALLYEGGATASSYLQITTVLRRLPGTHWLIRRYVLQCILSTKTKAAAAAYQMPRYPC